MTNDRCHFTHPFAGRCKYPEGHPGDHEVERQLLTLENVRSGAVPSDAVAVGFLLGEIARLTRERDEYKIWWERDSKGLGTALNDLNSERHCKQDMTAQRDHWLEIAREKDAELERLNERLETQRGVIANHVEALSRQRSTACEELKILAHLVAWCPKHESLTFHSWIEKAKALPGIDKIPVQC